MASMLCVELLFATEIIAALQKHRLLPQVMLVAERPLVEMTIKNFHLQWEVVRSEYGITVVRKLAMP